MVQGEQAADDIVRNIQRADAQGDFDTMIIYRGGGSIEDLYHLMKKSGSAIHAATTPIISSVGHETDVTIADMVADVRAATPTAAAELAVPVLNEELLRISERRSRLEQSFYISCNNEQNVSNDYKTLMCLSNLSGFMKVKRLN